MKKTLLISALSLGFIVVSCSDSTATDKQTSSNEESTEQVAAPVQEKKGVTNVGVDEFEQLIQNENGIILDVRTPGEWSGGTLEGAVKIDFYDANFKSEVAKLDQSKEIYVYCKVGGRSGKAAQMMSEMGYTVYNLNGGFMAWSQAGKPIAQ